MSALTEKPIWRPVVGWPEYEICRTGEIRRDGKPIKPFLNNHGYLCFNVINGPSRKMLRVHREVARCFVHPFNGDLVRHLNGNKTDCDWTNLAWGTCVENEHDKKLHGRSLSGERHHHAKLTLNDVLKIRASSISGVKLAVIYNVTPSTICSIRRGRSWV